MGSGSPALVEDILGLFAPRSPQQLLLACSMSHFQPPMSPIIRSSSPGRMARRGNSPIEKDAQYQNPLYKRKKASNAALENLPFQLHPCAPYLGLLCSSFIPSTRKNTFTSYIFLFVCLVFFFFPFSKLLHELQAVQSPAEALGGRAGRRPLLTHRC